MTAFLRRHWFLILLAITLLISIQCAASLGLLLTWTTGRSLLVFAVMFVTGWTLPLAQLQRVIKRPTAAMIAIASNLFLVPVLSVVVGWWFELSFLPGLIVAAWMPCTLASAAVWTRRAGGDDSIAFVTTVVTNLSCVVVAPIGIASMFQMLRVTHSPVVEISATGQIIKLALLVAAPLILAQSLRYWGGSGFADRHKSLLSVLAQIGILTMVCLGGVTVGQRLATGETISGWIGCQLVTSVSVIHVVTLIASIALARWLRFDRAAQIGIGFAASQKTLMVGLQVAIDAGVSVLPIITYHVAQLVIDTIIADRWR
ncbi:MAG: bile acid:sodium symporter [Planctomycetota bacterium]